MLFRMTRDGGKQTFQPFQQRRAKDLDLKEKDLENWIAAHPELLFGSERVLVFAQSVSGECMADILALDTEGRVIVVEMKRDWSNRATVGQLLEYAAQIAACTYDELDESARRYAAQGGEGSGQSLIEQFREFVDDETVSQERIGLEQRLCIAAPKSDDGLRKIVEWLSKRGIRVDFVPFSLYSDDNANEVFLDIDPLPKPLPDTPIGEWEGDWIFNTNERYAENAYKKMFEQGVIAIYGYETGPANLTGSESGHRVFAYVNKKGIMAVGRVLDGEARAGATVYGREKEFHVKVEWTTIVSESQGVTCKHVREACGYNMPVISAFCHMSRHDAAEWIERELKQRKGR